VYQVGSNNGLIYFVLAAFSTQNEENSTQGIASLVVRIMYRSGVTSKQYKGIASLVVRIMYRSGVTSKQYKGIASLVVRIMYRSGVTSKQYTRNS
jgi:hypothetical protein